jgi:hypothetical protein
MGLEDRHARERTETRLDRTDLVESHCLLFPERAHLAQRLASDEALTAESKWLAMEDLYTLCTRDSPVLYLLGCQPVEGTCPVCLAAAGVMSLEARLLPRTMVALCPSSWLLASLTSEQIHAIAKC